MTHRTPWFVQVTLIVAALAFVGCGKKVAPPIAADITPPPVEEPTPEPPPRDEKPKYEDPMALYPGVFVAVHFEFNKYRITEEAKPKLEKIAKALNERATWKILVEGHCDERGTNEYNMGLGEQRALATKRYLVSLGVSESRFQTISYGEERPVDTASTESAWAKNRRAEFRVEAPRT